MKVLELIPDSWPISLQECPAGFFLFNESLCFKSQYGNDEVFCHNGEAFWGGTDNKIERGKLIVQPLVSQWTEF